MSDEIIKLEAKLKGDLESMNIQELSRKAQLAAQLYDSIVPMINESLTLASREESVEAAYKTLTDKLRSIQDMIAKTKVSSEQSLIVSIGKRDAIEEVLSVLTPEVQRMRDDANKQRIDKLAEKIQSGSFDPESPRKIGSRPEKIKSIREAKKTLFGVAQEKATDEVE